MASLIPYLFSQFFDSDGNPLAEGTLTFYAANTEVLLDTYSDADAENANQNPLELNSAGRSGPIFLQAAAYDIVLKNADGDTVGSLSNVSPPGLEQTGTFTMTLTGCTATISGPCQWSKSGRMVHLLIPLMSGTSNNAATTLTGLPEDLWPSSDLGYQSFNCDVVSSAGTILGKGYIDYATGVITLLNKSVITTDYSATWPTSGTKGIGATIGNFVISYMLE